MQLQLTNIYSCFINNLIFSPVTALQIVFDQTIVYMFSCTIPMAWQLSFQTALIGSFRDEWINYRQ